MCLSTVKTQTNPRYHYIDYENFDELASDPVTLDQLIQLYRQIFSEPDGWNEQFCYDQVRANLMHELSQHACLRLCTTSGRQREVVGFCWAQLLSIAEVAQTIKTVQYYDMLGSPQIEKPLQDILGNVPVIYLHDLGIKRELRGKLSLSHLIQPVLQDVARQTGIKRVLFWTIANTHVSRLARRGGFRLALLHSGMQFYIGQTD